ncbi:hypothetical protein Tco_1556583 [Tanacetum coccineum]
MVASLFIKFKEDKVRMLSVQDHKGMLQVYGEIHQVKQRLSSAIIVKAEGKELDEEQLSFLVNPGVADAKAVLMADLLSCDSDVLSEVPYSDTFQNDIMNQSVKELQYCEQSPIVDYPDNEITSDSNIIPYSQYLQETQHVIVQNTNTSAQQNSMIISMFEQMSNHATNWDKANNESKIVNESLTAKIERYRERMKNTKFAAFEMEIDTLKQTLSKHVKENESLLTTLNGFKMKFKQRESKSIDKEIVLENMNKELENIVCLHDEITKVQTVFNQMEAAVEQCSVDSKCCKIQQKQFLIENNRLLDQIIYQYIMNIVVNSSVAICDFQKTNDDSVDICNKCLELEAELVKKNDVYLQAKDIIISKLKETIHSLRDNANLARVEQDIDEIETINIELEHNLKVSKPNATTIALGMFKLDLDPLAPKVLKNKDARIDYIKHSREHADTLREIVENARELSPLNSNLDSACKCVERIQEVLVYVKDTCTCLSKPSKKLVAITPLNKDKNVRFVDSVRSSSNTQQQVNSHKTQDSNQTLLHSTGLICSTSASGSKPIGNTKKNKISYAICNECLFDANHDKCVLDYVHDVNVLSKSKSAKCKNKKQVWKPTGNVYTDIGYKWKPTGRTFTIVRNKCPLTRFTSTKIVPLKETTIKSVLTPTPGIKIYNRIPKATKSVGSSSKSKIIESRIFNNEKSTQSRGSTVSIVLSSSLIDFRLSKLFSGIWTPDAPSI